MERKNTKRNQIIKKGNEAHRYKTEYSLPLICYAYFLTLTDKEGLFDIHCDDVTRRLIVIPKQYKIIEIHRHVYRKIVDGELVLVRNEKDYINTLGKTMVSSSIVSEIICNKFINSLPLYRQEMDYKNKGLNLSRQDMSNYCM